MYHQLLSKCCRSYFELSPQGIGSRSHHNTQFTTCLTSLFILKMSSLLTASTPRLVLYFADLLHALPEEHDIVFYQSAARLEHCAGNDRQ